MTRKKSTRKDVSDRADIIAGQHVSPAKLARARQLRREMTPQEKKLWERLRANRLSGHHFRRQQVVDGFILDFYHHQAGLVIETDGPVHDHQADYDEQRSLWLKSRHLRVIRFTNAEIDTNLENVLTRIRNACDEFGR